MTDLHTLVVFRNTTHTLSYHDLYAEAERLKAENDELRDERDDAYGQLRYLWNVDGSCPCGARRESPKTHPHVGGCPTAKAVKQ